jgi:hypothetical protein
VRAVPRAPLRARPASQRGRAPPQVAAAGVRSQPREPRPVPAQGAGARAPVPPPARRTPRVPGAAHAARESSSRVEATPLRPTQQELREASFSLALPSSQGGGGAAGCCVEHRVPATARVLLIHDQVSRWRVGAPSVETTSAQHTKKRCTAGHPSGVRRPNIYKKLGATKRAEAVKLAERRPPAPSVTEVGNKIGLAVPA